MPAATSIFTPPTLAQSVDGPAETLGRAAYRRGEPMREIAAEAWKRGWIAEAHLASLAARSPAMAGAMHGFAALVALEAANRVLTQCTVNRPTIRQQQTLREAKPLIDEALRRLTPAAGRDDDTATDTAGAG